MRLMILFAISIIVIVAIGCRKSSDISGEAVKMSIISNNIINDVSKVLIEKYGIGQKFRVERGVRQAASFWMETDGSPEEFEKFCIEYYIADSSGLENLFQRLSINFENIIGNLRRINLELKKPVDLDIGEILPIDRMFAGYDPYAHINDDFFKNKIAFYILLNFPFYSLGEKEKLGVGWSRKQWAYARIGDMFTSRIPAELLQKRTEAQSMADQYISDYNIYVGYLQDNEEKTYFDKEKKLISHWNLRDEIKSQYSNPDGLAAQKIIYEVMKKIITQEIPKDIINNNKYYWNPYQNKVIKDGHEIPSVPEPDTRYQHILNNFKALKAIDPYCPYYPTYIKRKFEEEFEIPQETVEKLFIQFVSSPLTKRVAELIGKRLGRKLEPFDIWYDGFKSRSAMPESELNKKSKTKYPSSDAFALDMKNILIKLGFNSEKADFISSKVVVEPSRGAGHASGAEMRSDNSNLRTRVGKDGMDYKGYNIAVHEFGHNVEQTITLQDVDYYLLRGVPNTAFTEAWAFVFQKRDLDLLGIKADNPLMPHLNALDNFWMTYEIMGVSLIDMNVWKWLYENPQANAQQLKETVIRIAVEIWNKYYADVFGIKDQPILAIYSHMIDYPLYLSAYPLGHIIEFQMEQQIAGKNLADEMQRMLIQGRIIPQLWMKGAVGSELSIEPTLKATEEALKYIK